LKNTVQLFFYVLLGGFFLSTCSDNNSTHHSSQSTEKILRFCLYASDDTTELVKKYMPFIQYVQAQFEKADLPVKVILQGYPSYKAGINAMVSDKCEFMRSGPVSYILAKKANPDIRLLAMEHVKGKTRFNGMIVTRADSPIKHLSDLKGTRFAFGNEHSTIGRYLSQAALLYAGVYAEDFKLYDYLSNHDEVAINVMNGQYHAGALKENTYKKYKDKLKPIATFENVTKPWMASASLSDPLFNQLQEILFQLKDKSLLRILKKSGFKPVKDEDYDFVRQQMRLVEAF
jgi:phosphonate transport system substrate-binding protein